MSILSRLFRADQAPAARVEPVLSVRAQHVVDSSQVRSGSEVWAALTGGASGAPSEGAALAVSAVYACVTLLAGAISSLPMQIYRRSADGDRTADPRSDLWWVLNEQFSPRWSASAGWNFMNKARLLHGDAFAEIVRGGGGRIVGLVPIHPSRVRVIASPDGMRLLYEIQPDPTIAAPDRLRAQVRVLDQDDVLHVPGFGFDGLRGMSPLRHALRVSGRLAISAQDFTSSFFQNMARPDYALQTDGKLTDEQFDRLQESFNRYRGPLNAGNPMVLEGGLKVETLTMPMTDMQLLESRRFQVEEIARIYGVPPFMIGHTDKTTSWGSGVEAMGLGFVRFTLRDHLTAFGNEINRKFFARADRVADFDTRELERADTKSLFEALRIALGRAGEQPIMSLSEVREFLSLPREIPGGSVPPAEPEGNTE